MDNNEIESAESTKAPENGATTKADIDYKALYEKLQKDNANLSRYSSELKSKLQEKLTDEEKMKASQEERENYYKQIEREYKSMQLKNELSKSVSDGNIVDGIVGSFLENDINGGIEKLNKYIVEERANYEKKIQQASLLKNPTPPAANDPQNADKVSQKDFDKMGYNERVKLKNTDPELYEKLSKNKK